MSSYGLVSIGSHTGAWLKNQLIIFKDKKNILIEPVPYNLLELKQSVKNSENIIIEESAISDKDETTIFFHVKKESINKLKKHWASGIGSFDKSHLLKHKSKRFLISESDIEGIKINCLSFSSLVKKYSIKSIEKLMLDVEGAEYKILKSIDFTNIRIDQIFFEKKHFDGYMEQGKKFEEIRKKLIRNNYKLSNVDDENILAEKI